MEMDPKEKGREQKSRHLTLIVDLARSHNSARTKEINEIAEWMAAEVKRRGKLDHHEAANAIRMRSPYLDVTGGRGLILANQERNDRNDSIREVYRFGPPVLQAFRELTGKTVRWGKNDRYWVVVKPK
jgi:hypothetical protein